MPISQTCKSILSVIAIVLFSSAAGYSSDQPAEHVRSGEHQTDQGYHHSFGQAGVWAKKFDDPSRDAWQKPEQILDALNLGPTARVADLGAGTGYFSVRIAKRLPEGKVFAIDIEPEMLSYLSERARREHLSTVIPVVANEETPNIPEPVDLILVVDTYHHIDDRIAYFNRLRKSLNPGGRLAIVDFKMESPEGPPPEHRVSAEKVTEELKAAGYSLVAAQSFLPRQYFLVFTAPPS